MRGIVILKLLTLRDEQVDMEDLKSLFGLISIDQLHVL